MSSQKAGGFLKLDGNLYLEVLSDIVNPLIGRREIQAKILHQGRGTPSIPDLRLSLAKALNVDFKLVYIRKLLTQTGSNESKALIHIYRDIRDAQEYEPKHVKEKNKTLAEEIEEEEMKEKAKKGK